MESQSSHFPKQHHKRVKCSLQELACHFHPPPKTKAFFISTSTTQVWSDILAATSKLPPNTPLWFHGNLLLITPFPSNDQNCASTYKQLCQVDHFFARMFALPLLLTFTCCNMNSCFTTKVSFRYKNPLGAMLMMGLL